MGMALPGAVLPALMRQWSLEDSGAGWLFFLAWLGSSLGALAAGRYRRTLVAAGCALVGLALAGIAYGPADLRFVEMFVYGLGLGGTMTAISLTQASRHAEECASEMNRLNMIWAAGAVATPPLAAHSLRVASAQQICAGMAGAFLVWAGVVTMTAGSGGPMAARVARRKEKMRNPLRLWPLPLLLLAFLPTGIESTMGGWVAEYARREQQSIATAVMAGSLFWGGILASRALGATRYLKWRTESGLLVQSAWTVLAGLVLLVAAPVRAGILCGNALVGFGLGPVYPVALALGLKHREAPGIFWVAGVGSAMLPWLTGLASTASGSLRMGLLVTVAAGVLLVVSGEATRRGEAQARRL